ncbi:MAG: hypothetical protein ACOYL8_04350 [Patescibacteria group bacterium]
MFACSRQEQKISVAQASPCEQEVASLKSQLRAADNTITELRIDTAALNAEIRCLKLLAECKDCNENIKAVPAKKAIKKAPAKKSQTTIVETPIQESRIVRAPANPGTPNLSYLREGGEIIFCTRANGRNDLHFPDLAIKNGVTFSNFQNNTQKGYNWKVEPTNGYQGDYGVTTQGVFYVSDPLIQKVLQKAGLSLEMALEIKCPYTGWAPKVMTKEGTFWVYRTQR